MSVRAPGEECLTQTQMAQREMLAQIRQKQQDPGLTPSGLPQTGAAQEGERIQGYGSPHSKYLDITV